MNRKKIFIIAILASFAFPTLALAASFNYAPMEQIPGFTTSGNFYSYISAVYKFGIWAVGVSALLMITIGGYMYIMSAANVASAEKAKEIITDAIIGLILALVSYLLLYEINPNLVKLRAPAVSPTASTAQGGTTTASGGTTTGGAGTPALCDGTCNQVNSACLNNSSSINSSILKSIVTGGEGCNKSVSSDGFGSCGYSQALPSIRTACGISGTPSETCVKIQNDVTLDINCAAWLIKNQSGKCGTTEISRVGCCYNGGPNNGDCHKNAWYGPKVTNYYKTCNL
ncbi:MAG: hypothetical protein UT50_C0003G0012 [Candidatus Moranbacteria bacterium GW2011_GWA2_39_41]|nr:MAG: hypothetical protein UT50_C0003G0012 [Candidatus Moranbacteria bacterium GW2011_GWA2_39_41]